MIPDDLKPAGSVPWPILSPDNPRRSKPERHCDWCGRLYRPWVNTREPRFCSIQCRDAGHVAERDPESIRSARLLAQFNAENQAEWERLRQTPEMQAFLAQVAAGPVKELEIREGTS